MIKHYNGEYKVIANIFRDAIYRTAAGYYSQEQILAWCPREIDYHYWKWRCELKRPFVYWRNDNAVGFIELDYNGHIDCHYVSPEYNRQGIGGELLRHVIQISEELNMDKIFVEASHGAKGLYLKNGFMEICLNKVLRNGVIIDHWILERKVI